MSPLSSSVLLLLAAATARAHFTLDYPATIGFSDDDEPTAPCGSFTPNFSSDNVTEFHVGGDNIITHLFHSTATLLYRATLDVTAGGSWHQLFPEVQQSGLGVLCEPSVTAPASWAGKNGVLNVVVDAPDGLLFQCAAVKFVAGAASSNQAACSNSSIVTAAFGDDSNLASYAGSSNSSSGTSTASGTAATTATSTGTSTGSASTASSTKKSAAASLLSQRGAVAAFAMALFGSAYLAL